MQRDGALAEYIRVPTRKLCSANRSITELCLVESLTVGFHAVAPGRVTRGDSAAIFGCGGVGRGAIITSSFRGAQTIAVDAADEKLETARAAGATNTIHGSRDELHKRLAELTDGHGPDVVVEAIGLSQTFRAAVEEVAFTGRVVYTGYPGEPVTYETKLLVQKELDILRSRNALPDDFRAVIRMLDRTPFPVKEAISRIVGLEEAPEALRSWSDDPSRVKKILMSLD